MMRRYWTFQLAGWLAYSAAGIGINLLNGRESIGPLLAGHAAMIASGIGLTHLLRGWIRKQRRQGRTAGAVWPLLAASAALIGAILTALVVGINMTLANGKWDAVSLAGLWWGMSLASGIWTLLYVRFSESRRHQAREEQLQLALKETQLRVLESQLNPHFLFNCLNSIRALVEMDPPRARDMLTRLANVLRNSLRGDREHTVALEAELSVVSDYIALEALRFGGRLRPEVRVDTGAARCTVPPMILQTLVENAIKHGIGRIKGPSELEIEASMKNQSLWLTVANTGSLNRTGDPGESGRVGLKNVRERLALLYGDRARFTLEETGGRVVATAVIPVTS